jgi:hypothetical protein
MQALANNFAKVEKDGNKNVFGKPFRYVDAFLRKVQRTNQIVTIEQFASGTLQKYVNNDGTISHNKDIEKQRKAEKPCSFFVCKVEQETLVGRYPRR